MQCVRVSAQSADGNVMLAHMWRIYVRVCCECVCACASASACECECECVKMDVRMHMCACDMCACAHDVYRGVCVPTCVCVCECVCVHVRQALAWHARGSFLRFSTGGQQEQQDSDAGAFSL